MQHKHLPSNTVAANKKPEYVKIRDEILRAAIKGCKKFDGVAMLDKHYTIIDTRLFDIVPKEKK